MVTMTGARLESPSNIAFARMDASIVCEEHVRNGLKGDRPKQRWRAILDGAARLADRHRPMKLPLLPAIEIVPISKALQGGQQRQVMLPCARSLAGSSRQ